MTSSTISDWKREMQSGQHHFRQGGLEAAARCFANATNIAPSRAEGWVNLGVVESERGNAERALTALQQALRINPKIAAAHATLGDVYRVLGEWDNAIKAYKRAVTLQKTPVTLNKLACALRANGEPEKSEPLYQQALRMDHRYTLAQVNLATLQAELQRLKRAERQIEALEGARLSPSERQEISSLQTTLKQAALLRSPLEEVLHSGELRSLEEALHNLPSEWLQVDEEIIAGIETYARSARQITEPAGREMVSSHLPEDWPLLEALSKTAHCDSVAAYQSFRQSLSSTRKPDRRSARILDSEQAIRVARDSFEHLTESVVNEMHVRHWHALVTRNIDEIMPGHYKLVRNMVRVNQRKERAQPHLVIGTMRYFLDEIYSKLPPGLCRGLVFYMAISDIHPFIDGNGRVSRILINRELEHIGQMPFIIPKKMDFSSKIGAAIQEVRKRDGDISPLLPVIGEAQDHAMEMYTGLSAGGDGP